MPSIILTPIMFQRHLNRNDLNDTIENHEIKRLGLKAGFCDRIKSILMFTDANQNADMTLQQGDIVTVFRDRGEQIVIEHVSNDGFRQEFLALKDLETNQIMSMLDVLGKCTFIRKATEEEVIKHNVWLNE